MLKKIWLYLYMLPQNLVGLFLVLVTRAKKVDSHYVWNLRGSISLGWYIILSPNADEMTLKHENGHYAQSFQLGWLYLIVIGLPSLIWAGLRRLGLFKNKSYYWFYTEKWANKNAGIEI